MLINLRVLDRSIFSFFPLYRSWRQQIKMLMRSFNRSSRPVQSILNSLALLALLLFHWLALQINQKIQVEIFFNGVLNPTLVVTLLLTIRTL